MGKGECMSRPPQLRHRQSFRWRFDRPERALVCPKRSPLRHRLNHGQSRGFAALRQEIFYPRPPRARCPDVCTPLQPATQARKSRVDRIDPGEGRSIERRVALGAKRRDAQRDGDNPR
jgi:hypothetical protein